MAESIMCYVDNGTDGDIDLVLAERDETGTTVKADLSGVSRVVLDLDASTSIDSAVVGGLVISWTNTTDWHGSTVDVLRLRLGGQSLTAGTYEGCTLTIYDALHTNGVRWPLTQTLNITVRD